MDKYGGASLARRLNLLISGVEVRLDVRLLNITHIAPHMCDAALCDGGLQRRRQLRIQIAGRRPGGGGPASAVAAGACAATASFATTSSPPPSSVATASTATELRCDRCESSGEPDAAVGATAPGAATATACAAVT